MCSAGHIISTSTREDILATNTPTDVLLNSKNLLPASSELGDRGQATINPAIKVNMGTEELPQPTLISASLPEECEAEIIQLLKASVDRFAWKYSQMLGLGSSNCCAQIGD